MAAVGNLHPQPARTGAQARRQPARADAEMAIKNARDVYTRRNEGVSIWAVQSADDRRQLAGREGADVRAREQQGLSASDVLPDARGSEAPVTMATDRQLFDYLLRLADNDLILAQRLGEWVGHGPALEEDMALTNVGLDLLGQARLWFAYAGEVEARFAGAGRDEDQLAFLRDGGEFRNLPAGRAAERQLRRHDGPAILFRRLARSAAAGIGWLARCAHRRDRREGAQGSRRITSSAAPTG